MQKYDEKRQKQQEEWLDDQKREVLAAKMRDRMNPPQTQPMSRPLTSQYDPNVGFDFYINGVKALEPGKYNFTRINYTAFDNQNQLFDNNFLGPVPVEVDQSIYNDKDLI